MGILEGAWEIGDLPCADLEVLFPQPPEPSDRVALERGTTGMSGSLSPSEPISDETGPVGRVVGFALPPPDSLAPPEGRGPPLLPPELDCATPMGLVGHSLTPTEGASVGPSPNLHLLPGLQRLLDGLPFVRGLRPPQPKLPQRVQTESWRVSCPCKSKGGCTSDTHSGGNPERACPRTGNL